VPGRFSPAVQNTPPVSPALLRRGDANRQPQRKDCFAGSLHFLPIRRAFSFLRPEPGHMEASVLLRCEPAGMVFACMRALRSQILRNRLCQAILYISVYAPHASMLRLALFQGTLKDRRFTVRNLRLRVSLPRERWKRPSRNRLHHSLRLRSQAA